jgi:hypothetical protein
MRFLTSVHVNVIRSDGAATGIAAVAGHEISEDAMYVFRRVRIVLLVVWRGTRER